VGREEILAASVAEAAQAMTSLLLLLPPAGAAVLTGGLARYLALTHREGVSPGSQGWWDDSCAFRERWGFDLADISVPVLVLHGRQDTSVPCAHGE
jgi:pimeloyl-ACP methyl ester carboxylesterase